jgi:hypothetical protein
MSRRAMINYQGTVPVSVSVKSYRNNEAGGLEIAVIVQKKLLPMIQKVALSTAAETWDRKMVIQELDKSLDNALTELARDEIIYGHDVKLEVSFNGPEVYGWDIIKRIWAMCSYILSYSPKKNPWTAKLLCVDVEAEDGTVYPMPPHMIPMMKLNVTFRAPDVLPSGTLFDVKI